MRWMMLLVAGYSLYRAPKQPVAVQKIFMVAVAGLCFLLAVVLALPQFAPAGSAFVAMKPGVHGSFWFLLKVGLYLYLFLWLRFTFPRYRFDQLMKLGWHLLIPASIVNVLGLGVALYLHRSPQQGGYGWGLWSSVAVTTVFTLLISAWLLKRSEQPPGTPASESF